MPHINKMYGEAISVVQLHYARAAADLGSFSNAARWLGVTQPALSNGIASFERALGGVLFQRSTAGATLTPLGAQVLPHIRSILRSVEDALGEVDVVHGREKMPLRVGVSPLIHPRVIARALDAASRNNLGPLVLTEDNMMPLRDALLGNQLDIILVPAVAGSGRFAHRLIEAEPLHYLSSRHSQDAMGAGVELSDVMETPLVMVGDTCGLTTFTNALFANAGQDLQRYPGEADSYRSVEDWAGLGLGGALLPRSKFRSGTSTHPVFHDGAPVVVSYEALWDPESGRGALANLLVETMLEQAQ